LVYQPEVVLIHGPQLNSQVDHVAFAVSSVAHIEANTVCLPQGVPGRSNALNIAARLGLPGDVVDAARQRLGASQVG